MKRNTFLFLSMFIATIIVGQNTKVEKVNYENSDVLHYEYEFIVGKTAEVSNIVSRDSETKQLTGYDPGGYHISDKVKHGYYKEYYEDGTLKRQLNYAEGKRQGKGIYYYPSGKVESEFTFSYNVLVGDFVRYHENGEKMDVCQYKNGKRVGRGYLYYDDGSLYLELDYLPNKEDNYKTDYSYANAISYYPNGEKRMEGRCKIIYARSSAYETTNLEYYFDGDWVRYDERGNLISREHYVDDLIEGKVINYYPSGSKKEELECTIIEDNGEKQSVVDGIYISYYENGQVNSKGMLIPTENDDGTITPKKFFVWRWYDENGQPKEYQSYIADEMQKAIKQPAISEEENINTNLPFSEIKRIVLSKYGRNYFFHFEEACKPYLGCKMYFDNCSIRRAFYTEVEKMLVLIYKELESCTTIECLEKWAVRSNTAYQILEEASKSWTTYDFDITTKRLSNNESIENKLNAMQIE